MATTLSDLGLDEASLQAAAPEYLNPHTRSAPTDYNKSDASRTFGLQATDPMPAGGSFLERQGSPETKRALYYGSDRPRDRGLNVSGLASEPVRSAPRGLAVSPHANPGGFLPASEPVDAIDQSIAQNSQSLAESESQIDSQMQADDEPGTKDQGFWSSFWSGLKNISPHFEGAAVGTVRAASDTGANAPREAFSAAPAAGIMGPGDPSMIIQHQARAKALDMTPEEEKANSKDIRKAANDPEVVGKVADKMAMDVQRKIANNDPHAPTLSLSNLGYEVGNLTSMMAPVVVAGTASPAMGMSVILGQSGMEAYGTSRAQGHSKGRAATDAAVNAALSGLVEIPILKLIGQPGKSLIKKTLHGAGLESTANGISVFAQNLYDSGVDPDKSIADTFKDPDTWGDIAIATVAGGLTGGFVGAGSSVGHSQANSDTERGTIPRKAVKTKADRVLKRMWNRESNITNKDREILKSAGYAKDNGTGGINMTPLGDRRVNELRGVIEPESSGDTAQTSAQPTKETSDGNASEGPELRQFDERPDAEEGARPETGVRRGETRGRAGQRSGDEHADLSAQQSGLNPEGVPADEAGAPDGWKQTRAAFYRDPDNSGLDHEELVRQALDKGENVPVDVLVEYPELAEQISERKPEAQAQKPEKESADHGTGQKKVTAGRNGNKVSVQGRFVDADDLITSNTAAGNKNPNYPESLQPRDRSRLSGVAQVDQISRNLDPELLDDTAKASDGAPIVGEDNVVESGNGRVTAIRKAYEGDRADGYKRFVERKARKAGVDISGMERPVYVRQRATPMNDQERAEFTRQANQSDVSQMSPAEQAQTDAGRLTTDDLALFDPGESGNVLAHSNQDFLRRFAEKTGDVENLRTMDGRWNKHMADRVQGAVFAKAYDDPRLLQGFTEEADPDMRNVLTGLQQAAPDFARAGKGELDTEKHLTDAVELVRDARAKGQSIDERLSQLDAFSEIDPGTADIARVIDANKNSSKRLGAYFKALGRLTEHYNRQGADRLFGDTVTTQDIIDKAGEIDGINRPRTTRTEPTEADHARSAATDSRAGPAEREPVGDGRTAVDRPDAGNGVTQEPGPEPGSFLPEENLLSTYGRAKARTPKVTVPNKWTRMSMSELVKTARQYARAKFSGTTVRNIHDGSDIKIPWQGIKHSLSGVKSRNAAYVAHNLDQLIANSTPVSKEPDRLSRANIKAVHRYESVQNIEGRDVAFNVIVRESQEGKLFYDHYEIKSPDGSSGGDHGDHPSQPSSGRGLKDRNSSVAKKDKDRSTSQVRLIGLQLPRSGSLERGNRSKPTPRVLTESDVLSTVTGEAEPNNSDIRFSRTQDSNEPRNLYVSHNITAEGLRHADELGGLAAPSLGIGNVDVQALDKFGDITLLAKPKLLQSAKAQTFDADVFSPRQPKAEYVLAKGKHPILAEMKKTGLDMPDVNELESSDGPREFARSPAVEFVFLREQGKLPRLYNQKVEPEVRRAAKTKSRDAVDRLANEYYRRLTDVVRENADNEGVAARLKRGLYFDADGHLKDNFRSKFNSLVRHYKKNDGKDIARLMQDMSKRLRQPAMQKKYEAWATDQFNSLVAGKRLFKGFTNSGNRRYSDYTLSNVVKEMTRELRNGENWNYGAGSVRAGHAQKLRNQQAIQSRRDRIVSSEEMDAIREQSNDRLMKALKGLEPYYKFDADSFRYTDDASSAIAEGPGGWRQAFDMTPESREIITNLVDYLKSLPTEYFESKIGRAVGLDEFDTAIVPRGTDKATIDRLKRHGIKIKRYKANDPQDRQRAIRESGDRLLFSRNKLNHSDSSANDASGARPARRLMPSEVNEIAARILGMNPEDGGLTVVDDFASLPREVREAATRQGVSDGDIKGMHFHGKSYLIADQIHSADQVAELVFHEHYTHGGLRAKFDREIGPELDKLYRGLGGMLGVRREARKQGIDLSPYDAAMRNDPGISLQNKQRVLTEELLAHMSKTTGTLRRRLEELMGAIRAALRKLGYPRLADYTTSDLAHVLRQARSAARQRVRNGSRRPTFQRVEDAGERQEGSLNANFGKTVFRRYSDLGQDQIPIQDAAQDLPKIMGFGSPFRVVESAELGPMTPARFNLSTGEIEVNPDFDVSRSEAAQYLAEEVLHGIDSVGSNRTLSSASAMFDPQTGRIGEAVRKHFNEDGPLSSFLRYPMDDLTLTRSQTKAELFARLGVLYLGEPQLMSDHLPAAYRVYHDIFALDTRTEPGAAIFGHVWSPETRAAEVRGESRGIQQPAKRYEGFSGSGQGSTGRRGLEELRNTVAAAIRADRKGQLVQFSEARSQPESPVSSNTQSPLHARFLDLADQQVPDSQVMADAQDITGLHLDIPIERADLPEFAMMRFDPDRGVIQIAADRDIPRPDATMAMAEELYHGIDVRPSGNSIAASSNRFRPGGDIWEEALEAMQRHTDLNRFLDYPLGPNTGLSIPRKSAELFARMAVLYTGNPEAVRRMMPKGHAVIGEVHSEIQRRNFKLSGKNRHNPNSDTQVGANPAQNRSANAGLGASRGNWRADPGLGHLRGELARIVKGSRLGRRVPKDVEARTQEPGQSPGSFLDEPLFSRTSQPDVPDGTKLVGIDSDRNVAAAAVPRSGRWLVLENDPIVPRVSWMDSENAASAYMRGKGLSVTRNTTTPTPAKTDLIDQAEAGKKPDAQPENRDVLNKALREEDKSVLDSAKRILRRNFLSRGLAPQEIFDEFNKKKFESKAIGFKINHLTTTLDKAIQAAYGKKYGSLDDRQKAQMNRVLAGDPDRSVPSRVRAPLAAMRTFLDGLSEEYANILENQSLGLIEQASKEAGVDPGMIIDAMNKASDPLKEGIGSIYDGYLNQGVEPRAASAKANQSNIRDALSKAATISTIRSNVGQYVHRSYRAFDDPKWYKKVPDDVANDARRYLTEQYKRNGKSDSEAKGLAEVKIKEILHSGTAFEDIGSAIKGGGLGKDTTVLVRRKQIAPEIRALLGEYTDPRTNFVKSATKMGNLIWSERFLNKIREIGLGRFMFEGPDRPSDAYVQIAAEGSKALEPLNGLWVTPEIKQAFEDMMGDPSRHGLVEAVVRVNGATKFGLTVLSPTTALRNFQSGFFFTLTNGHFDVSKYYHSIKGLQEYFTTQGKKQNLDYLQDLIKLGVIHDTARGGELIALFEESKIETLLKDRKHFDKLSAVIDFTQKFYEFGDDFWKIIGFENEKSALMKNAGLSEAEARTEAATRIRNTYPTYSMSPRAIKMLQRNPLVGTFVNFTSETIRTRYHMLRYIAHDLKTPGYKAIGAKRAIGLALSSAAIYASQGLTSAIYGISDDEEKSIRAASAPWNKNSNLLFAGRDDKGNIQFYDLSYLDPYNFFKRPMVAIFRDQPWEDKFTQAAWEMIKPFLGSEIGTGTAIAIATNKKPNGGRVYNPNETRLNQIKQQADYARRNMQPGILSNIERTWKAIDGKISPSGKRYELSTELMGWLGWRATSLDFNVSLYYRSFEFQDELSDSHKTLYNLLRDPNEVSFDKIKGAYKHSVVLRRQSFERMRDLISAARSGGLSDQKIRTTLTSSGVSRKDANALLNGYMPMWQVTPAAANYGLRKARAVFDPKTVRMMRRRYSRAQGLTPKSVGLESVDHSSAARFW